MDAKELRSKSIDELREEEKRLKRELFETRFRHGTRQLGDTGSIQRLRRDVARCKTLIGEKQREAGATA